MALIHKLYLSQVKVNNVGPVLERHFCNRVRDKGQYGRNSQEENIALGNLIHPREGYFEHIKLVDVNGGWKVVKRI